MYTVYILYSEKFHKTNVGYTTHLALRFYQHNGTGKGWTSRYRPWKVAYCEYYDDKSTAIQKEKWLKS